jgi:two-component system cell cycle sensor histidine kinase/response regulator CckA
MQSGDNAGTSPISEWPPGTWSPPDVPSSHSAPLVSARVPHGRVTGQRSESLPAQSLQPQSHPHSAPNPQSGVHPQGGVQSQGGAHERSGVREQPLTPSTPSPDWAKESGTYEHWRRGENDAPSEVSEHLEQTHGASSTLTPTLAPAQRERDVALLAAGLGHDLNNLLVGVLGNAELAQAAYLRGEDPIAHLLAVRAAAERASALATSMVRLASDQQVATSSFDLSDLVAEIVMLARAGVSKSAHVVRGNQTTNRGTWPAAGWDDLSDKEVDKAPLLVRGDSGRIGQVVLNLIVNGADALGASGGEVHIDVQRVDTVPEHIVLRPSESVLEGFARLRVSDTGSGIPVEALPRIFEPYFSTKRQGRGLGLANCLEIVREHGGGLQVTSEVGSGTTFEVYLPLSGEPRAAVEPAVGPSSAPEWRTSGRVLVVDDEPMVARLTAMVLEHVGLQPTIGHTGADAIELLRQSLTEPQTDWYRVIVVDLTMPDLSGQEVLELIRILAPEVPVVLTSGFSEQQLRQRGMFSGFDGFLQKPFRMSSLVEVLQGLLEPAADSE